MIPKKQSNVTVTPDGWSHKPFLPLLSPMPSAVCPSVLPEALQAIVISVSKALEVPLELPLACCLGVVSAVCQGRYSVRIKPGWVEPTSLFIAVPADPGERKTPTLKIIAKTLFDYEKKQRDRCLRQNAEHSTHSALIRKQIRALEGQAAKANDTSALASEIDDLRAQLPVEEIPPRVFCDDVTPERLLRLMAEHQGNMAVLTDEGGPSCNVLPATTLVAKPILMVY